MKIERLAWDSDFFGYEIGKMVTKDGDDFDEILLTQLVKDFKLIYIFSKANLEHANLKLVDKKITFQQALQHKHIVQCKKIMCYKKDVHSYVQLLELAYASGIYSRFRTDKQFKNEEFKKLYKKWLDNSIIDTKKYEVLVYVDNNELLGFATYDIDQKSHSSIGLFAVHSKARGMGIASKLLQNAMCRMDEKGIANAEVATQLDNIPASKLYKKSGFENKNINYIYHYWNI